jgi:hypothetical protein
MKLCVPRLRVWAIFILLISLGLPYGTSAQDYYAVNARNKKSNSLKSSAKTSPAAPVREPPVAEIAEFLKVVSQKRIKCQKKKTGKAQGICSEIKVLLQLELLAKAYISVHKKAEIFQAKSNFADQENDGLKNEMKAVRSPASFDKYDGCLKKDLLRDILLDYGVNVNGSNLFSKKPVGEAGVCWTNSKKKKEATISICDYPLAIFLKTMGGVEKDLVIQDKQYLFALNACDLVAFHRLETSRRGPVETFLTYDECRVQWNKRTADAAMTPTQVRLMEDTIGACFREHLLPLRAEQGGRANPHIPPPPEAKIAPLPDPDN